MKRWLAAALSVSVGCLVGPGNVSGMDLAEALSQAYLNNPTLLAQRAKLRGTDEDVSQAIAGWRPNLNLESSAGQNARQSNTASGTNKSQQRDTRSLELALEQPLYNGGSTVAATIGAENGVLAERARLRSVEQSVLLDAVNAYMDVVRDQAVLELNLGNEQVLRRQAEATNDRFRVGEVTRTDVSQAAARLAGAVADTILARGNLQQSRAAFINAVGVPPGHLVAAALPEDLPKNHEEAVKQAVSESPSVKAAAFEEASRRNFVDQVKGGLLPEVTFEASASRDLETSAENSRLNVYEGKFILNIPLYQSGSTYSRLRAAKQSVAQQRLVADQARRDAIEEGTRSWEALQTVRARIKSFNTQISANLVALEGVQREAAVGSRTVLDVLDAEQELLDSKVNLVGAQRDEVVAAYRLRSAVGQLTARGLGLSVPYYDPEKHYREVRDKWFGGSSSGENGGSAPK
jgi:outer membrane protein